MRRSVIALLTLAITACGGSKSNDPEPEVKLPTQAVLLLPVQDEACTSGRVISSTQSAVMFSWNTTLNTSSYELTIKNLSSGASTSYTSAEPKLEVNINRNTPYSWFVTSKSTSTTQTAKSAVWKFYNSGPGVVSYAPFPAEIIAPLNDAILTVGNGKIGLSWKGSDVDNDVKNYDVYFGTTTTPAILSAGLTATALNDVSVTANTTYYWKVITRDTAGNTSDSGMFSFMVK